MDAQMLKITDISLIIQLIVLIYCIPLDSTRISYSLKVLS